MSEVNGFKGGNWQNQVDVRDFIFCNFSPYDGDEKFLAKTTDRTKKIWDECLVLIKKELSNGGVLDVDSETISSITSHNPGYIDKNLELVVGLQTDYPLKRAIKPFGGWRVVAKACEEKGKVLNERVVDIFSNYRKSHNDGVFGAYTEEMRNLRRLGVITGLPDNYARGRIIGDYRRMALYGADFLIAQKQKDADQIGGDMTEDKIRLREEISDQILSIQQMKQMASSYGFDISQPATTAQEAIQWTYFAFLAAIKEQDGAAMSLGNLSEFFDVYIEKDLRNGLIDESKAQELVDDFVIKLRLVRHLRTEEYDKLFAGDPTWATLAIGGSFNNNQHKITKTSYRFLQTLYNMGPSPEPNITILWSKHLPENFKRFCAKVSIDTSSLQYENDDLMRHVNCYDDYGIACCVSYQKSGKQIQFFGARCNLGKTLLLALNGGRDEKTGILVVPGIEAIKSEILDYDEVMQSFEKTMKHIAGSYVNTMNVIHYMHDKYYYEKAQMAMMDTNLQRTMAFGVAGLSVVADSLSAIKFSQVKPIRNEQGLTVDFEIKGDFPKYGNDDDRVDTIAQEVVKQFNQELASHSIYRNAKPTLSVLTITSNVVYGEKTGATPDGRKAGEPFAPGANPMHGRDTSGVIASLNSVAKIDYEYAQDGVSNTFSIVPKALGSNEQEGVANLTNLLDGYFGKNAHHLNVNVFNKETLLNAMEHPENYPQLTIRVSGYAVNFVRLSRQQQEEVLARTFFEEIQ